MIENVQTALQAFATTGNGFTVTLLGPRFLTFKVQGNGNVTAGSCGNPMLPAEYTYFPWVRVRGSDGLDNVDDHSRSSKQGSGLLRRECVGQFPRADHYARNRRNRHSPCRSARGTTRNAAPPIVSAKRKKNA